MLEVEAALSKPSVQATMLSSVEYEDVETGYVTDSSLSSRKGVKQKAEPSEEKQQANRRKTKSERDKRRSSRISNSLLESNAESESESSSLEQNQPRYRKRAGSKRIENEKENESSRHRRKTVDSKIFKSEHVLEDNFMHGSTCTLKMDNKDIYCGTWNPKERAVFDQIITNSEVKSDKRTFKDLLKWKKEKFTKIVEEERIVHPVNEKQSEKRNTMKFLFSGLKKFKQNVLKRNEKNDFESYFDDPLQDYVFARKKKGLFNRFSRKKEVEMPRRRAQSTNDYMHSVASEKKTSNLSRNRFGSSSSIKNLFSRGAKSVDNLHGAFEYFANNKQIFQRTPSVTRLDKSRAPSMERLDNSKRSNSIKSLSHGFEPAELTAKDICYNEKLVYAQAKLIQPHRASQRSLQHGSPFITPYDSAFEDDFMPRGGYNSDRAPSVASAYPAYNHHKQFDSDCGSFRAHSSMSAYVFSPSMKCPRGYVSGQTTPGYATPGSETPGYMTPMSATPQLHRKYNSDNASPKLSMIPFHARRVIEKNILKTNGNLSESSFCEEDELNASGGSTPRLKTGFNSKCELTTDL